MQIPLEKGQYKITLVKHRHCHKSLARLASRIEMPHADKRERQHCGKHKHNPTYPAYVFSVFLFLFHIFCKDSAR